MKAIFSLLALFAFAEPANAIFELRANVTYHSINPGSLNDYLAGGDLGDEADFEEINSMYTIGGDGIFTLPFVPIGVGARYEWIGIPDQESEDIEFSFSTSRLSLLVNYRILDMFFFLGPIATLGLYHSLEFKVDGESGGIDFDLEVDSYRATSYSLGIEGGVSLGLFLVGAEVGYMHWSFEGLKDGDSHLTNDDAFKEIDLSGLYGKLLVGLSF